MPEKNNQDGKMERKVEDQVDRIKAAFKAEGVNVIAVPAKNGKVEFMYAEGQLLVQDSHSTMVWEFLNPDRKFEADSVDRVIPGVARLFLPEPRSKGEKPLTVPVALRRIDRQFGEGLVHAPRRPSRPLELERFVASRDPGRRRRGVERRLLAW